MQIVTEFQIVCDSAVQDSQKIFLEYTVVCLQYVSIVITNQKYDNESHYQTKIFSGTIEQSFESTLLRILYVTPGDFYS